MSTLTTKRLFLRRMTEGDVDIVLAMEADLEVMRFSTGIIHPSEERRNALIEYVRLPTGPMGHWAVDDGSECLGWVSLTPLEDTGRTQIAYRLVRRAWGHGYATEAAAAVLAHGFSALKLSEIVAIVWLGNLASVRVLEKLGFEFEGESHHYDTTVKLFLAQPSD